MPTKEPERPAAVPVDELRYRCSPETFSFQTTEELDGEFEIIGQQRAVKAIQLGLAVSSKGYNIIVQGLTGTGRETTVKSILEKVAHKAAVPGDICYVHNFEDPDRPIVLYLGAGFGARLRKDMHNLVEHLARTVPAVLESEEFKERRAQIIESEGEKGRSIIKDFEERIKKENFVLVELRFGPMTKTEVAPIVDGKPRAGDELERMLGEGEISREEFERVDALRDQFGEELEDVLKHARDAERQISEAMTALVYGFGAEIVNPRIDHLKEQYRGERVERFLEQVRHDVLENLETFIHKPDAEQAGLAALLSGPRDRFLRYRVNLLVDNSKTAQAPIVVETHPTYKNLFGTIERTWDRGGMSYTDLTRIKAGSLLEAAGGYLVVSFSDILSEPGVYQSLKRTLKSGKVDIQGFDPTSVFSSSALQPEPIDVDLKVLLIGDAYIYQLFYQLDPDFRKIFKIKADFDSVMDRNEESVQRYASFVARVARDEKLLAFDATAVAAVVEEGIRIAGRQSKLSTRFSEVADLIREADYWARQGGADVVRDEHIARTVRESILRRNLIETRIAEMIREGILMISSDGARVGQVNGLSIYDVGDYRFGRPTKITASVATGRAGIINIERESDLSGRSHNKGMLILAGYFRSRFAQRQPLSLSASVAFEQSYSGVDGDSASSTELYALLSALSELPLRQDIAVTGSVNQKGEVQAIGGVNEKIEGFFDTCDAAGLTGRQGVMIPSSNVGDLMLRRDIVEAVRDGKFHVHPVTRVEEGIEILSGVAAGDRDPSGAYPPESVYGKVQSRLERMIRDLRAAIKAERDELKLAPGGDVVGGGDTPPSPPPEDDPTPRDGDAGAPLIDRAAPAPRGAGPDSR